MGTNSERSFGQAILFYMARRWAAASFPGRGSDRRQKTYGVGGLCNVIAVQIAVQIGHPPPPLSRARTQPKCSQRIAARHRLQLSCTQTGFGNRSRPNSELRGKAGVGERNLAKHWSSFAATYNYESTCEWHSASPSIKRLGETERSRETGFLRAPCPTTNSRSPGKAEMWQSYKCELRSTHGWPPRQTLN